MRAIEAGEVEAACFGSLEQHVLAATTQVVEEGKLDDERMKALQQHFTTRELVELMMAVGIYEAVGKLMNVFGLDSQPPMTADFAAQVNAGSVEAEE